MNVFTLEEQNPPEPSFDFASERDQALTLLGLRLCTLIVVVAALTMHLRSVRVFRWEQSVSGGVLVTYTVASLGLAMCTSGTECGATILQVYLSSVGAMLLGINAFIIWRRWREADPLTHAVAELLHSLGMPIQTHLRIKVALSAIAAIAMLIDAATTPLRQ